jgi:amidophosphoribosyltransferase
VGELQPFVKGSPKVALAHNGNIVNTAELTSKFQLQLETASDLDVLQQIFLLKAETSFEAAVQSIFDEFNGSYAVVGIEQDGTLFGFRDPFGIRPLFLATVDGDTCVRVLASETAALTPLGDAKIEEIAPGEWVRVSPEGTVSRGRLTSKRNPKRASRFCMFEGVYFSSPQSELHRGSGEPRSVYRLRFRLGQRLASEIMATLPEFTEARSHFDYVVPVPDTSRSAALAVAETMKIPYREFLVKNNYVPRTFILGKQDQRL